MIGTSAGGYQALSIVLESIPADYALPIIVVQHRAKDSHDLFEEILQRRCKITVKQADEKESVLGGVVYTAPPDYHLLIEMNRTFSLSLDPLVKFSRPAIDVLFEAAAYAYAEKLVGIVLTGSNSDGADGMVAIRKRGGLTIAQDPAEAEFSLMPQASIDTRQVTHVWTLRRIRDFLLSLQGMAS